jgi:hypothetical protein
MPLPIHVHQQSAEAHINAEMSSTSRAADVHCKETAWWEYLHKESVESSVEYSILSNVDSATKQRSNQSLMWDILRCSGALSMCAAVTCTQLERPKNGIV